MVEEKAKVGAVKEKSADNKVRRPDRCSLKMCVECVYRVCTEKLQKQVNREGDKPRPRLSAEGVAVESLLLTEDQTTVDIIIRK